MRNKWLESIAFVTVLGFTFALLFDCIKVTGQSRKTQFEHQSLEKRVQMLEHQVLRINKKLEAYEVRFKKTPKPQPQRAVSPRYNDLHSYQSKHDRMVKALARSDYDGKKVVTESDREIHQRHHGDEDSDRYLIIPPSK